MVKAVIAFPSPRGTTWHQGRRHLPHLSSSMQKRMRDRCYPQPSGASEHLDYCFTETNEPGLKSCLGGGHTRAGGAVTEREPQAVHWPTEPTQKAQCPKHTVPTAEGRRSSRRADATQVSWPGRQVWNRVCPQYWPLTLVHSQQPPYPRI